MVNKYFVSQQHSSKNPQYFRVDDDEPLCCCEFLSEYDGNKKHLLQCCCDCVVLDDICEKCMRCESVPRSRLRKLLLVMLDRCRVPSPGGAVKLTWKHLLPFVVYPALLHTATYGLFTCIFGLLFVLYGTSIYSQIIFNRKQKNALVGCFIWSYLFYTYIAYLLYFYPHYYIPQLWLALQHVAIILFIIFYLLTLSGPGYVPLREDSDQGGQQQITYVNQSEVEVQDQGANGGVVEAEETFIKVDETSGVVREYNPVEELYKANPKFGVVDEKEISQKFPQNARHLDSTDLGSRVPTMEADELVTTCSSYWPVLKSDWFYCTECKMLVPPQSAHCKTCERCVYEIDHHCFWLDCCVGLQNKRWFAMLLITMICGNMYNAYIVFKTVCPVTSWYCQNIFMQSTELKYVYITTLYGLLVSMYQFYPTLRMLISISTNVSLIRLNRYIKSKVQSRMNRADVCLSYRWLVKYNQGFFSNWSRCLLPPPTTQMPTQPPPSQPNDRQTSSSSNVFYA